MELLARGRTRRGRTVDCDVRVQVCVFPDSCPDGSCGLQVPRDFKRRSFLSTLPDPHGHAVIQGSPSLGDCQPLATRKRSSKHAAGPELETARGLRCGRAMAPWPRSRGLALLHMKANALSCFERVINGLRPLGKNCAFSGIECAENCTQAPAHLQTET